MLRPRRKLIFYSTLIALIFNSCRPDKRVEQVSEDHPLEVIIRETTEPDGLHPTNSRSRMAYNVLPFLFQTLLAPDLRTGKPTCVLCDTLPTGFIYSDSLLAFDFTLRAEAQWDDGEPITNHDVVFSFYLARFEAINNHAQRALLRDVLDVRPLTNNRVRVLVRNRPGALLLAGNSFFVLPRDFYDPENVLLQAVYSDRPPWQRHPDSLNALYALARSVNQVERNYTPNLISGSGAYRLKNWKPGQELIFERKSPWWADSLYRENHYLCAFPSSIQYVFIQDQNIVLDGLKSGKLDVVQGLNSRGFALCDSLGLVPAEYQRFTAPWPWMNGIAINTCLDPLSNVNLRQALHWSLPRERFVRDILRGMGRPTCSLLHPDMNPMAWCPDSATTQDTAKAHNFMHRVDQVAKPLPLTLFVDESQPEQAALHAMWAAVLQPLGVELKLEKMKLSLLNERVFTGNYQLAFISIEDGYRPLDPGSFLHSSRTYAEGNVACLRSARVDSLCAVLERTQSQQGTWHALQNELLKEMPYLYLSTNLNKLLLRNRFDVSQPYAYDPGYWAPALKVREPKRQKKHQLAKED